MSEKKSELTKSSSKYYSGSGPHVALLFGGMSAERDISILSSEFVLKALLNMGYKVTAIDPGVDFAQALLAASPDVVFNCLHGTYGEDGTVPAILDMLRLPYTHSGAKASLVCFHKDLTKSLCLAAGVLCPRWRLISQKSAKMQHIEPPYVIKPLAQGSSLGVEIVFSGELGIESYSFPYGGTALVENYIPGREIQVAVLNGKAIGMLEIKCLKKRFYDYDTKYTEGLAEHISKPNLPEEVSSEILALAEKVYSLAGCRGIARAEFIYGNDGKSYFLEINTHPGFTGLSICPEIAMLNGINFKELIRTCLESACFDEPSEAYALSEGSFLEPRPASNLRDTSDTLAF